MCELDVIPSNTEPAAAHCGVIYTYSINIYRVYLLTSACQTVLIDSSGEPGRIIIASYSHFWEP